MAIGAQGGNALLQVPANDVIDDCATVSEDLEISLLFLNLGFFLDGLDPRRRLLAVSFSLVLFKRILSSVLSSHQFRVECLVLSAVE